MSFTLEDLDHRIAALELAQSAKSGNTIVRIEQKVDAATAHHCRADRRVRTAHPGGDAARPDKW